jgi:outer membrane protein assembly factor BamB
MFLRILLLLVLAIVALLVVAYFKFFRPPTNPAVGKTLPGDLSAEVKPGPFDWPQYRGPARDGTSPETGWIARWSSGPNVLWQAELGTGASSVAVSRGRLYAMGNVDGDDIVYCRAAETGREIWRFTYVCSLSKRQFEGGPAATPTVDGDRVYTFSHEGQLFCLDALEGTCIWSLHAIHDLGGSRPFWGYACSPLVAEDKVIVSIGGRGSSSAALDKNTGKVLWKSGDDKAGYSSPVLFDFLGVPAIAFFKGEAIVAQALASGKELWRYPWETSYDVNAAMPAVRGSKIFVCSGYDRGAAVLDFSTGAPKVVWQHDKMRNHFNSCLFHEGHMYGIDDGGELKCLEFDTGAVKWEKGRFGKGSLILGGDKLIVLSEGGELVIAAAKPQAYEELGRASVLPKRCWVSPALASGLLYVKNNGGKIVCLDLRG